MSDEFKEGDTVRLKSGGPVMTINKMAVHKHSGKLNAVCKWFDGDKVRHGEFLPFELMKIDNPG